MKIPDALLPITYTTAKKIYAEKLSVIDGINKILGNDAVNKNSIRVYLNVFRNLMKGEKFTRTLNVYSMDFFLKNIRSDFGDVQLKKSLESLDKHIEYYEASHNTTVVRMRSIRDKYYQLFAPPVLIKSKAELLVNIEQIEKYLVEGTDKEKNAAAKLIKNGACFIAYQIDNEIRFTPSRFSGYINNKIGKFTSKQVDGGRTNNAISIILNSAPRKNIELEDLYQDYINKLGINLQTKVALSKKSRRFWKLDLSNDFAANIETSGEFPEGKIFERMHKFRERSSKVIEIAKTNFKGKHGKLFCEICDFDYEQKYGELGHDFIEGHHTIFVSDMPPDHKTKPEEIAMLCGNCHRMVHKRRPWLPIKELKMILE